MKRISDEGEYHDSWFDVQSNALLVANVFEKFWNMCLEIYELDRANFIFAPWLTWQETLKKRKVKLALLTDMDTLLMAEKGIRGGICYAIS